MSIFPPRPGAHRWVPLRKAAPKCVQLTRERPVPFPGCRRGPENGHKPVAGFITVGDDIIPGTAARTLLEVREGAFGRVDHSWRIRQEERCCDDGQCTEYLGAYLGTEHVGITAATGVGEEQRNWGCPQRRSRLFASITVAILPTSCVAPNPPVKHLSLPTPSNGSTRTDVPGTYKAPSTTRFAIVHCPVNTQLLSTQRLQTHTRMHTTALPILPISCSRFTAIGTEMTYSNTCDPARPPAESERSVTSHILMPGQEEKKKMHRHS